MDCHNRPTHIYKSPDTAVNISLETGRIDRTLPYAKKFAVEALTGTYRTRKEALSGIESHIRESYRRLDAGLAEARKTAIETGNSRGEGPYSNRISSPR